MAYPDDIDTSEDYLLWTNTITVQYVSKGTENPNVGELGVQVTHVLWKAINKAKLTNDSPLQKMDRTFRLARIPLGPIVPKNDDIIIDKNGVRWRVMLVEIVSYGNEFRCHTIKSTKQNAQESQNTPVKG